MMRHTLFGIALILLSFSSSLARLQTKTLTCESADGRYHYCLADHKNSVTLTKQLSKKECLEGLSWGYDGRGIWVDRGCQAEFEYGGGTITYSGSTVFGTLMGGMIVGGIVASHPDPYYKRLNALQRVHYNQGFDAAKQDARYGYPKDYTRHNDLYDSASEANFEKGYASGYVAYQNEGGQDQEIESQEAPNWLIGTFRGLSQATNQTMELRIFGDGQLRGRLLESSENFEGYYRNSRVFVKAIVYSVQKRETDFVFTQISKPENSIVFRRVY